MGSTSWSTAPEIRRAPRLFCLGRFFVSRASNQCLVNLDNRSAAPRSHPKGRLQIHSPASVLTCLEAGACRFCTAVPSCIKICLAMCWRRSSDPSPFLLPRPIVLSSKHFPLDLMDRFRSFSTVVALQEITLLGILGGLIDGCLWCSRSFFD